MIRLSPLNILLIIVVSYCSCEFCFSVSANPNHDPNTKHCLNGADGMYMYLIFYFKAQVPYQIPMCQFEVQGDLLTKKTILEYCSTFSRVAE